MYFVKSATPTTVGSLSYFSSTSDQKILDIFLFVKPSYTNVVA